MDWKAYNARLTAILAEKALNPVAYKADGYLYFEEFLPIIHAYFRVEEGRKPLPKPVPKPVVEAPKPPVRKMVIKKVEPKKVVKKRGKRTKRV